MSLDHFGSDKKRFGRGKAGKEICDDEMKGVEFERTVV